jgi:hypothetical protein
VSLLALILLAPGGCGSEDRPAGTDETGERGGFVLEVKAPLRSPVLGPSEKEIFALRQDGSSLAKVDVSRGGFNPDVEHPQAITSLHKIEGRVGENLALERGRRPDKIYVPVPGKDQIFVSERDDLLEVNTFTVGDSPTRVALDRDSEVLFALSEGRSTITVMDLVGEKEIIAEVRVGPDKDSLIEVGGGEGFWVAGPGGIAYYEGPPFGSPASLRLEGTALAADASEPGRAYAAGSGRVVAVEPKGSETLEVVAGAKVDGRVTHLAAEEERLYAITPESLLVLTPDSLKTLSTVDFGRFLDRKTLEQAAPSGLAVAQDNLYLTLEGVPFLMQIKKPEPSRATRGHRE